MEKGIDSYLKEQFEIPDVDIRTYSPLTLAYIGDGIYDLVIRSLVVAVYKRGRNAKSFTMAKNATMSDYRKATGFEALMGYLYLKDEFERLVELVKTGAEEMKLKL